MFVDGDFWHGRDWHRRKRKLAAGSNPAYWLAKIAANRMRDRRHNRLLETMGWAVVRVWETDVKQYPDRVAASIARTVERKLKAVKRGS